MNLCSVNFFGIADDSQAGILCSGASVRVSHQIKWAGSSEGHLVKLMFWGGQRSRGGGSVTVEDIGLRMLTKNEMRRVGSGGRATGREVYVEGRVLGGWSNFGLNYGGSCKAKVRFDRHVQGVVRGPY